MRESVAHEMRQRKDDIVSVEAVIAGLTASAENGDDDVEHTAMQLVSLMGVK